MGDRWLGAEDAPTVARAHRIKSPDRSIPQLASVSACSEIDADIRRAMLRSSWSAWLTLLPYTLRYMNIFVHTAQAGVRFNSSIAALSAWLKDAGHGVQLLTIQDDASDSAESTAAQESWADVVGLSFMTCRLERVAAVLPSLRAALPAMRASSRAAAPTTYPTETLAEAGRRRRLCGRGEPGLLGWLEDYDALTRASCGAAPGCSSASPSDRYRRAAGLGPCPLWRRHQRGQSLRASGGRGHLPGLLPLHLHLLESMGTGDYTVSPLQAPCPFARWTAPSWRCSARCSPSRWSTASRPGTPSFRSTVGGCRPCSAYASEVGQPLAVQLRVEQVTEGLVGDLARAGCDYAVLGLECGDEAYRKRFLDKPFTNAAAYEAVRRLGAPASRCASFIMGLPFETPQHLAATVRMAREIGAGELSWRVLHARAMDAAWHQLYNEANDLLRVDHYVDHPSALERR